LMRLLIDNSLSYRLADLLLGIGHDAAHMREHLPFDSPDDVIFDFAAVQRRVLLAQDTDFGTILAKRRSTTPSVVLFRGRRKAVADVFELLTAHIPIISEDLESGAIVVFDDTRIRVRRLPIG